MFVVIDGPDGSGKTTLAKQLTDWLNQEGMSAIYTFEPTFSSEAGQKLRNMMRTGKSVTSIGLQIYLWKIGKRILLI